MRRAQNAPAVQLCVADKETKVPSVLGDLRGQFLFLLTGEPLFLHARHYIGGKAGGAVERAGQAISGGEGGGAVVGGVHGVGFDCCVV